MRRRLLCVPMMTLVLLTACGGTAAGDPAEELALAVRGEYLAMERCAAEVEITADYGQRVYEFLLSAAVDGEETVLTLREPELAAGITARISEEGGVLEYDGLALETWMGMGCPPCPPCPHCCRRPGRSTWRSVRWSGQGTLSCCGCSVRIRRIPPGLGGRPPCGSTRRPMPWCGGRSAWTDTGSSSAS